MVFDQKWSFFQLFFLGNIGQGNVFYDILEPKIAFLGYKNKKFKKSQNTHFSKGVTHGSGPLMTIFPTFFFRGNIGQEDFFYDILAKKIAFLGYKKYNFKKSKNWYFSDGVNPCFWSKNGHFSNLFLKAI